MEVPNILTERLLLRQLTAKDATEKYLSWFSDASKNQFIAYKADQLSSLVDYIEEKNTSRNSMFWGIFCKNTEEHIGNFKFEPIDWSDNEAALGILIGEAQWRGKSLAKEIINACFTYIHEQHSINVIRLGVDKNNTAALKAYEKIGFIRYDLDEVKDDNYITMKLTKES